MTMPFVQHSESYFNKRVVEPPSLREILIELYDYYLERSNFNRCQLSGGLE